MCLDTEGSFSRADLKLFERITPVGFKPALIFADGGFPLAVCRDGNLYYSSHISRDDDMAPGGLRLTRMSPDGGRTPFAPALEKTLAKFDEGVTGLAAGPDGSLYVASPSAILKVKMDGAVMTLVHPVVVTDCDEDIPSEVRTPYSRSPFLRKGAGILRVWTGIRDLGQLRRVTDVSTQGVSHGHRPSQALSQRPGRRRMGPHRTVVASACAGGCSSEDRFSRGDQRRLLRPDHGLCLEGFTP